MQLCKEWRANPPSPSDSVLNSVSNSGVESDLDLVAPQTPTPQDSFAHDPSSAKAIAQTLVLTHAVSIPTTPAAPTVSLSPSPSPSLIPAPDRALSHPVHTPISLSHAYENDEDEDHPPELEILRTERIRAGPQPSPTPTHPITSSPAKESISIVQADAPTFLEDYLDSLIPDTENDDDNNDEMPPLIHVSGSSKPHLAPNPHALTKLPLLHPFGIGLNQDHGLIVCGTCSVGIRRENVYGHIKAKHVRRNGPKLPDAKTVEGVLNHHHVPKNPLSAPEGPIVPIVGIPIHDGFRCSVLGCGYACRTKDAFRHHLHGQGQGNREPSSVQIIYAGGRGEMCWAVQPAISASVLSSTSMANLAAHILQYDNTARDTSLPVQDPRLVTPFLQRVLWHELVKGKDFRRLGAMVQTPTEADIIRFPGMASVESVIRGFYDCLHPIVIQTDRTLLLYLSNPE